MQNNNRLGCLTGTGIFASFITISILIGIALTSGAEMFSPGELNAQGDESIGGVTSHAQIAECSTCHAAPLSSTTMNDLCVQCHQEIALQLFDSTSLHSIIMQKDPSATCRKCHPEHRGASALLTEFDSANFPHETLGYSLSGHQLTVLQKPFACSDCHHNGYEFSLATCDECHRQMDSAFADSHAAQFGAECLACHDGVDRYGKNFSHAGFFPLDGKHAGLDCSKCHVNSRSAADLQSASTDCFSCHQQDDQHLGAYGTACGVCHSPEGWTPAKFDHNLSVFKLEGEHANVACESCHVNNVYKGTPMDCYSCHQKDDEHNGQFGTACGTCHTPASWENATFDHNLSAFKLEGKHANVACESCHVNNVYKGTPMDCYSCHQKDDEHNGQFGMACETCHTPASWGNATFDHNLSAFKLDGAHVSIACEQCHINNVFKGTPSTCVSCHAEPAEHAGQFGTDCVACHTTTAWTPAQFNGQHTFPLNHGEGGTVSCVTCHPVNYSTYTCYGCHEHTESKIRSEHLEEGISNFQNCMECHADGSKHEGGD